MSGDVLEETEAGARFLKDASALGPQVARIAFPKALAGEAERLARVAANDAIHEAAPASAVEGSQVAPDRSRMDASVRHARRQRAGRACFPLNVADRAS